MTDGQIVYFSGVFGRRSTRVRNSLERFTRNKTPAELKDKLRFSYRELGHCLGCSPSHVKQVVLYGRTLTADGLETWRELVRQSVRLALGEGYDVHFTGRLCGIVLKACPVCGRARVIHYKGQSAKCAIHH